MPIEASVSGGSPITASVGETQIDVSVSGGQTQIDVGVSGGFGPSGSNGSAGAAATIAVGSVTTGAAGSSASVTNAGSSSAAVFNFTIPAGATGPQGPAGAAGSQGVSGVVAATAPVTYDSGTKTVALSVGSGLSTAGGSLSLASHTHSVSEITDAGTAATRNVPATGNAATTEVVLGSDTRLTNSRTPTNHSHGSLNTLGQLSASVNTGATVGGPVVFDVLAGSISRGEFGASAGAICQGNDSRLSDARTPTAHKTSHATGGTDALTAADIGAAATSHTHAASDITSGTLAAARLPIVLEQTQAVGNSGTSTALALTTGSVQTVTLNGNCTFTMPTATAGASITLILTQSGTFTATFTGVLWAGGTAPTITATASKVDVLVFISNGTSWFGTAAQNF